MNGLGLSLTAQNFPVPGGSHLVQWELVKQGLGLGVMVSRVGDAEPGVRRAAPWLPPGEYEVWLAAHRQLNTSRRVRLVYDWLTEALRAPSAHGMSRQSGLDPRRHRPQADAREQAKEYRCAHL